MDMKNCFKTLFAVVAVSAAASLHAQPRTTAERIRAARQQADTVVLSQQTDGDYTVSRILVREHTPRTSQYDLHYAISRSDLEKGMDNNASQLDDIAGYIDPRTGDTLRHVECIKVTGYASPDGPAASNKRLAAARARNFAAYLDRLCGASKNYDITVSSEALPWTSCRSAVESSSMPQRTAVLAIIDGNMTDAEKEVRLKRMPEAWNYLAKNILPPLRRVDVAMDYDSDRLMTVRRRTNPQPEIVVVEVTECIDECGQCCDSSQACGNGGYCTCCRYPLDEEFDGIMIEYFGCPDE